VLTLGIFIAILTRSVSFIFIVALLDYIVFEVLRTRSFSSCGMLLYTTIIVILTTLLVLFYQYTQTGAFLGFYKTHSEWGTTSFAVIPIVWIALACSSYR
jgi:hypothetical protein